MNLASRDDKWLVQIWTLILTVIVSCNSVVAQTPPGTPPGTGSQNTSPCDRSQSQNKGLAGTAKCLKHLYDKVTAKDGFHLVFGNVAPGSGITGGVGYTKRNPYPSWQLEFDSSARVSIRKYWEIDTNLRLTKTETDPSAPLDLGNLKMNFYGLVKDTPRLDFFGLGPESREQDRAVFHYREAVVGADLSKPMTRWLDLGGAIEGIWPDIITISNPTVNSVERAFTETTAPGITSQLAFFHLAGFAGLHSRGQPESRKMDYRFFYHVYQDDRFSFRRFEADLKNKFPFGKNELRIRGRASFSDTNSGNRVPFYLMETLGGSNIRGNDTLRGFRDYRFRDRDLLLLQTEYLRQLYGPLDVIVFYDTGKVAPSLNRFDQGRLRHTYGLGLVVVPRRGEDVLFRFYVAFGSGEGPHTFFGMGDLLGGRSDRLLR